MSHFLPIGSRRPKAWAVQRPPDRPKPLFEIHKTKLTKEGDLPQNDGHALASVEPQPMDTVQVDLG